MKLYDEGQISSAAIQASNDELSPVSISAILARGPESHEARNLRYRLKLAYKELGKASVRIYELRSAVAEVRALMSKSERSSYRTLLANYRELTREHGSLLNTAQELRRENERLTGLIPTDVLRRDQSTRTVAV